ncbi:AbrB/MazE/SpoVT family DNA-binding domain-containing protein [Zavarzinella formosa]|uniref:AbrB/MazE/SpoVT family DNA-binding domain-containing protein n=1 Tax=Zavarzinella formosa TaxID=360055 RepID=UPI0002E024FC|nr:AbrB/MazE/SpoVT family DNA-binding domain-containing protein [Zavarzinella formosa]
MTTDTFLDSSRVRVDPAGRVVIPSSLRSRLHITPGDELILSTDEDGIRLRTFEQVARVVQAAFAPYRREGESVVDELIAERRAEARREDGE